MSRSSAEGAVTWQGCQLRCVLCRRLQGLTARREVHHIHEGQGAAQRASDFLTSRSARSITRRD